MALTKKRWTNLETQILEVRHMSRLKFFHPGLTNLHFKTDIFEHVCGLPSHIGVQLRSVTKLGM